MPVIPDPLHPGTTRQRRLAAAALALLATGCTRSVTVSTGFPDPLVEPLPLTVGLRYTPEFSDFTYAEDLPDDVTWTFSLGGANRKLFDAIFAALFDATVALEPDADPPAAPPLDAIIEPELEALEFSLPRQSRSDQYAVWIRYNLNVFAPDGALITRMPISAYGQSDSRTFKGGSSMEQATIRAMRDAAASVIVGFGADPKIRQALLEDSSDEAT